VDFNGKAKSLHLDLNLVNADTGDPLTGGTSTIITAARRRVGRAPVSVSASPRMVTIPLRLRTVPHTMVQGTIGFSAYNGFPI
jgi:hypothetical protein